MRVCRAAAAIKCQFVFVGRPDDWPFVIWSVGRAQRWQLPPVTLSYRRRAATASRSGARGDTSSGFILFCSLALTGVHFVRFFPRSTVSNV